MADPALLPSVLARLRCPVCAEPLAEVTAGTSDRVRDLAARIDRSRTAEVALMATLRAAPRR
ncbi:hypothetical protein [Micromonospora maritima]|uniref:hypothetical protein n=1 Tax=Micromonospora maritima TaxID=986711 RepID=UPI001FE63A8B|nr:hypothetical protein [Micromonospora maritima]